MNWFKKRKLKKCVDELVIATLYACYTLKQTNKAKFICHSAISCCDTVFFSLFVARALCLGSYKSRDSAILFNDMYVSSVLTKIQPLYFPDSSKSEANELIAELFDVRMPLYDKVFASTHNSADKFLKVLEQFTYIIKSNYINHDIEDCEPYYDTSSPLPILDIEDDFACTAEVRTYFSSFTEATKPIMIRLHKLL